MSSRSSVAPTERVNIVYKSSIGQAQQEVELPLRLLVMGDFSGTANSTPIGQRTPIRVGKSNFDDALSAQEVSTSFDVENRLCDTSSQPLSVRVAFSKLADFSPDNVCRQVPELRTLVDIRSALIALKGPLGSMPAFRRRLAEILSDIDSRKKLADEIGLQR